MKQAIIATMCGHILRHFSDRCRIARFELRWMVTRPASNQDRTPAVGGQRSTQPSCKIAEAYRRALSSISRNVSSTAEASGRETIGDFTFCVVAKAFKSDVIAWS